ncbi:type II secretion system protein GspL [Chiayiivirga flava]|uniref:Type II secretion system protein L n=1 Tax=Chiayiivirga flava TaxID=659595 RepID=A0A7W8D3F5_9GAMM|nr:type II secretion system protein GspL [Chiayiivirga flava]MBB5207235.1 general secretion pathway protein L [Chiayiivirga flava]
MPARHLIRLLPDRSAEWLSLGRDGRVLAGPQPGLPAERADDTVVLLPAQDVLLLQAPRVAKQRRQLEQAIPYAIEDQLAAPVEQQHVALSERNDGDSVALAVIARPCLDAWLATLREAGIAPDRALPESVLLPFAAGTPTVWVEGTRAIVRYAESGAFAGSVAELPDWLALLQAGGHVPGTLRWIGDASAAAALPDGWTVAHEPCAEPLRWLAARLAEASGPDLLQGDYAARRQGDDARRVWRWAAGLAAVGVLAAFAQAGIERWQLQARHQAQRAEMEALLRQAMPGVTRIVDAKAQLAGEYARQRGAGDGSGGLALLASIAPVLAGSGAYSIDTLDYRADTIELTIRTSDVARLDALRESLAAIPSVMAEVTSAVPGSGGVEGKLRVRRSGA